MATPSRFMTLPPVGISTLLLLLSMPAFGQAGGAQCSGETGNSQVYDSSCGSDLGYSTAYIDVAGYMSTSSLDMCQTIYNILTCTATSCATGGYSVYPSSGAVVDARGVNVSNSPHVGGQITCGGDPFNWNGSGAVTNPSVLLLPAGNISTSADWVLPSNTHVLGVLPSLPSAVYTNATTLGPASNFSPSGVDSETINGIWNNHSAASVIKLSGTGSSIEHMIIDGGGALSPQQNNNGIYSTATSQGMVNDVTIKNVNYNALFVGQTGAGSGPYTNINVDLNTGTCGTGSNAKCAACAVMLASTMGLHGMTCIGTNGTSSLPSGGTTSFAGIYAVGSNTTLDDIHVESFYDGLEVYAGGGALNNVSVSNVVGAATVTNVVHICGNPSSSSCYTSSNPVSDISLFGVSDDNVNPSGTNAILDDQTGATFGGSNESIGLYVIGENINTLATPEYARFSTKPNSTTTSSYSPVWGVGTLGSTSVNGNGCQNYGAVLSNTTGTANVNILSVCQGSSGTWVKLY